MKIEQELLEITGVIAPKGVLNHNDRLKYLTKLARKTHDLPDEGGWSEISDQAKTWVNDCLESMSSSPKKEIPEFPDLTPEELQNLNTSPSHVLEKKPWKLKSSVQQFPSEPPEDQEDSEVDPATQEPLEPQQRSYGLSRERGFRRTALPGASQVFRELIIMYPEDDKSSLMEMSKKQGFEIPSGSATTIFYQTHATLRVLRDKGLLKL